MRQIAAFGGVGLVCTLAYAALYAALRQIASDEVSNALALAVTTVGNTAGNRYLTFGVRDTAGFWRDQMAGFAALGLALALTSGSLAILDAVAPHASVALETAVLTLANLVATIVRFLLLRTWFQRRIPVPVEVPSRE